MKNFRAAFLFGLIALVATVALAGESTYTLTAANASNQPNGASQTGAIAIGNGFRGVSVGIFDQRDGAVLDIDPINTAVRGYAWIYSSTFVQGDGGAGWLRFPELDVRGIADAGGIATAGTEGVEGQWMQQMNTTSGMINMTGGLIDYKLYYTTGGTVGSADGGSPTHRVTIVTHY